MLQGEGPKRGPRGGQEGAKRGPSAWGSWAVGMKDGLFVSFVCFI